MGNKTQHGNVQAYGPQYKIWHSLETTLNFTFVFVIIFHQFNW